MSNFTFGHNVFESRLLLFRQNASARGKGLMNDISFNNVLIFVYDVNSVVQLLALSNIQRRICAGRSHESLKHCKQTLLLSQRFIPIC